MDRQETGNEVESPEAMVGGYATGAAEQEPGAGQLLLRLHMLLRRRYWLLVLLSLVLGSAMGYGGFRMGYKTFRSTALIQILRPLSITGETAPDDGQEGEAFVAVQAGLIKNPRVIDMAMSDADWIALQRPAKETSEDFAQALSVVPKDRMIYVTFEDRDPRAVSAALRLVIKAYNFLYVEEDARASQNRMDILQQHKTSLSNDDQAALDQINKITSAQGTDDLAPLYLALRGAADRMGDLLEEVKTRQAVASKGGGLSGDDAQDWASILDKLEIEELSQKDQQLMQLLNERSGLERELKKLTGVHGYGETHPKVLETKKALESADLDVAARAKRVREMLKRVRPSAAGITNDPTELQQKVDSLKALHEVALSKAKNMGTLHLALKGFQEKREILRPQIDAFKKRIDYLNMQQLAGKKIKTLYDGGASAIAQTDTRIRFASMGAILGLLLAFGISIIPGLLDQRFHGANDTRVGNFVGPILGVLPSLPTDLSDAEHAAMAAYCVHQTRALLQMRHRGADGMALAVTSSVAGTGKTSLTLALGVSFATSGSRTLLIDCDVVGGGLSARISRMSRRKIGDLLRREGLISEQQFQQAMMRSQQTGAQFGQVCVDFGFVGEQDLMRVVESQDGKHMGVLEALAGEPLADCVAETGFPGLFVLPLGTASARHCASISPAALRRLLKTARGNFDTVLIDTGPVPGSLEASVVVPQADGVVLVVSKGEHRPGVARCVEHLRTIGAVPVGVVFNRASLDEVTRNASTLHRSEAAFRSSSGMGLKLDAEQSARSNRLGPVAQAVAGCAPSDEQGN
jgi:succinoglycan biosynthesis transport protein ExoP